MPLDRMRMVVGFLFWTNKVLLVQKLKPEWQRGLWNGVGGKCEPDEDRVSSIVREYLEETAIATKASEWTQFATEIGSDYVLYCFRSLITSRSIPDVPAANDVGEPLRWFRLQDLSKIGVIGNLNWLVPLALDWRRFSTPVEIQVYDDIRSLATW